MCQVVHFQPEKIEIACKARCSESIHAKLVQYGVMHREFNADELCMPYMCTRIVFTHNPARRVARSSARADMECDSFVQLLLIETRGLLVAWCVGSRLGTVFTKPRRPTQDGQNALHAHLSSIGCDPAIVAWVLTSNDIMHAKVNHVLTETSSSVGRVTYKENVACSEGVHETKVHSARDLVQDIFPGHVGSVQ